MLKLVDLLIVYVVAAIFPFAVLNFACSMAPTAPPLAPPKPSPTPAPLPGPPPSPAASLKVQFLGQACFVITSSTGLKLITDPYTPSATFTYGAVDEAADIVTVSHEHADHNNVAAVKGNPEIVRGVGVKTVRGITVKGVGTQHDTAGLRGPNTVFCFSIDGVRFCHAGDLGHRLTAEQLAEIGPVDVFFVPVGGFFTIDAAVATDVCADVKPRAIIPMHFRTTKAGANLATVEDFLKGKENVKRLGGSTFEFKPTELPASTQIIVLEHAR